jgi:hypothetical protein
MEREVFTSHRERDRFIHLRRHHIERMVGWTRVAPAQAGEVVRERWCGPHVDERACASRSVVDSRVPGTEWFEIGAFRRTEHSPDLMGLFVSAGEIPMHQGWGIVLDYATDGHDVAQRGLRVVYVRTDEQAPAFAIGTRTEIQLGHEPCVAWAPGLPALTRDARSRAVETELARLVESPMSLRNTVWSRLDALEHEGEIRIAEHSIRQCSSLPGEGRAGDGECVLVELTPEEEARARESLRGEITRRRDVVDANMDVFHALLAELLPPTPRE